jgi:hypothetical protein
MWIALALNAVLTSPSCLSSRLVIARYIAVIATVLSARIAVVVLVVE